MLPRHRLCRDSKLGWTLMRYAFDLATVASAMPPLPSGVVALPDLALAVAMLGASLALAPPRLRAGLRAVDLPAITAAADEELGAAAPTQHGPRCVHDDDLSPPGTGRARGPGVILPPALAGGSPRPACVGKPGRLLRLMRRASACTEVGGRGSCSCQARANTPDPGGRRLGRHRREPEPRATPPIGNQIYAAP